MEKRNFSLLRMGLTTVSFLATLLFILLMRSPMFSDALAKPPSHTLQRVETQVVRYQDNYIYESKFIGQIEARQTSQLGFEIGGMLKAMPFDEGDEVKVGDVLAKLDIARLNANKKQALANLAMAKANAKLAATTYKRVFGAHKANAVTDQEKDEAREARDASKSAEIVAQAQLETMLVDISKAQLLAPFDGVVTKRMVDLGTVVAQGQPILEIQQNANFDVRVGVTSDVANRLELGAKQAVLINGKTYFALIKAILPVRGQARTIDVILELNEKIGKFRSGDIARLLIEYSIEKRGFWVSLGALIEGQRGLWSLYVFDGEKSTVERRTVSIHYINSTKAYVFGAVDAGETVVIEGASKLVPNQQVQQIQQIQKVAKHEE